jgi:hypothetical protein
MEYVLLNVGDIAQVKTLSKICTLQLRGWLQRVWEEGVWVVSFDTFGVKELFVIQLNREVTIERSSECFQD